MIKSMLDLQNKLVLIMLIRGSHLLFISHPPKLKISKKLIRKIYFSETKRTEMFEKNEKQLHEISEKNLKTSPNLSLTKKDPRMKTPPPKWLESFL